MALLTALAACGSSGGSSSGGGGRAALPIDATKVTPTCFVGGETPLIDNTAPDPDWTYNDPHVLKVNGTYWMYASSTDNFDFPVLLYRLTSTDNVHYTRHPAAPILEPDPGAWDGGGVETPAVVRFKGKYHLFWTGYPIEVGAEGYDVFDFRIGHATSTDGVHWTRNPNNPIVAPSSELGEPVLEENYWYQFIVGEPGPVVYDDKIYLYFTAVGANVPLNTSLQVVGLTTSSDGNTWSAPQLAIEPDQTLFPRDEDWIGYSTPNAIVLDGAVHLFYDVAHQPDGGDWKQWRLHHSWSPDGATGWTPDTAPLATVGEYPWNTDEVRSADAFLDGQTLRLYYAGHQIYQGVEPPVAPNLAIAEKTCDLTPD
ncbi:MAG TPA: hypothetical protein VF678_10750 [bacterium]